MRRSMPAAIITLALLVGASLVGTRTVQATLSETTVDPTATRALGGSYAQVSGTVTCTAGEAFQVSLTVGQGITGAQARGEATDRCTGAADAWSVTALTLLDSALLQPGLVRVCWNVTSSGNGQTTDVRRGCRTVALTDPSLELAR